MTYIKSPRWKIVILTAKSFACALVSFILCDLVRSILRERVHPEPLTFSQFVVTTVACVAMSATILMVRSNDLIAILFTALMTVGGAILGFGFLSFPILGTLYMYDHGYGEYDRSVLLSVVIGSCAGAAVTGVIFEWLRYGRLRLPRILDSR